MQHVAELLVVEAAPGEVVAIGFPERADQRIAVLAADGTTISAAGNRAFMIDLPGCGIATVRTTLDKGPQRHPALLLAPIVAAVPEIAGLANPRRMHLRATQF